MTKRKYFSWTDEKREELREYINAHPDIKQAFKEAAVLFGVSENSCAAAYKYEPKRSIVTEVDPSELEPRKQRIMENALKTSTTKSTEVSMCVECEVEVLTGTEECVIRQFGDNNMMIKVGDTVILLKVQESLQQGVSIVMSNN